MAVLQVPELQCGRFLRYLDERSTGVCANISFFGLGVLIYGAWVSCNTRTWLLYYKCPSCTVGAFYAIWMNAAQALTREGCALVGIGLVLFVPLLKEMFDGTRWG